MKCLRLKKSWSSPKTASLQIHPFADVWPMMSDSELKELGEDIKENGLQSPIVYTDGPQIIDGRNRIAASFIVKYPLKDEHFKGMKFDDDERLLSYIASVNGLRRHLTEFQRAVIALEMKGLQICSRRGEGNSSPLTFKQSAKAVNVSERMLYSVQKIADSGYSSFLDWIKAGEIKVSMAEAAIKELTIGELEYYIAEGPEELIEAMAVSRKEKREAEAEVKAEIKAKAKAEAASNKAVKESQKKSNNDIQPAGSDPDTSDNETVSLGSGLDSVEKDKIINKALASTAAESETAEKPSEFPVKDGDIPLAISLSNSDEPDKDNGTLDEPEPNKKRDDLVFVCSKKMLWEFIIKIVGNNNEETIDRARKDTTELVKNFQERGRDIKSFEKLLEDIRWRETHRWNAPPW